VLRERKFWSTPGRGGTVPRQIIWDGTVMANRRDENSAEHFFVKKMMAVPLLRKNSFAILSGDFGVWVACA